MIISLWILVDNSGRIVYTDSNRKGCEAFKKALNNDNYKIIKLKGELK